MIWSCFLKVVSGWSRDVGTVKPELQKECGLIKEELLSLQMTVSIDSLEHEKLGQEPVKTNKAFVDVIRVLQKTTSEEQASRAVVAEKLTGPIGSVSAPVELAAKLMNSDKTLKVSCLEVTLLNMELVRTDTQRTNAERHVIKVRRELVQRLVRLNDVLTDRSRAEKLA